MNISSLLAQAARPVLVEAAYQAIRMLKHGFGSSKARELPSIRTVGEDPLAEGAHTAIEIIEEIERIEGTPIESLGAAKAKYIDMLADIVRQRYASDFEYDETRARQLLEKLRLPEESMG